MNPMETIQNHIEITRRQFISQLSDEITHYQIKLGRLNTHASGRREAWGNQVYRTIIERKQHLISRLS